MVGPAPSELRVGFALPRFERTVDLANWNRFAAVNDEFVPIHMDDEAGRSAGYPTAFGMGNLQVAYIHCLLREWLGPSGRVTRLAVQFRAPARRGSRNVAGGVITAVDSSGEETVVDLDVWIEDGAGETLTPGTATVVVGDAS